MVQRKLDHGGNQTKHPTDLRDHAQGSVTLLDSFENPIMNLTLQPTNASIAQ